MKCDISLVFFENKVVLYKEVEGICDEHFVLTLGEQYIEIYKITEVAYIAPFFY